MYKAGPIPFGKANDEGRTLYDCAVGRPLVYVDSWTDQRGFVEWRDNQLVEDELTFQGFTRGRSAARMTCLSKHYGCTVEVFLTDFAAMMPHFVNGKVKGEFAFCKRGQNYGYCLEKP